MNNPNMGSSSWAANSKKNTVHLGYWTGAWVVTLALAKFGPLYFWESNKLLTSIAILINLVAGLGYANLAILIPFKADISHVIMMMALIYLAGIFAGIRKYR